MRNILGVSVTPPVSVNMPFSTRHRGWFKFFWLPWSIVASLSFQLPRSQVFHLLTPGGQYKNFKCSKNSITFPPSLSVQSAWCKIGRPYSLNIPTHEFCYCWLSVRLVRACFLLSCLFVFFEAVGRILQHWTRTEHLVPNSMTLRCSLSRFSSAAAALYSSVSICSYMFLLAIKTQGYKIRNRCMSLDFDEMPLIQTVMALASLGTNAIIFGTSFIPPSLLDSS